MGRAFDLMWEAVLGSWRAVQAWLASANWDPRTWTTPMWVVAGAVLLLVMGLIVRWARGRGRAVPEMLLSHGELVFVDDTGSDTPFVSAPVVAPSNAHYQLRMTLSNLNAFPLQLMELAVRARGGPAPVVAEAAAVVPPHGSVDVVADFFDMPGDAGQVEVYLFSNRMRGRTLRMTAPLEWEPWDRRYRVKALSARIVLGRALASQQRTRRARRAYQRERFKERSAAATQEAMRRADDLRRSISERRQAARQRSVEAGEALSALHGVPTTGPGTVASSGIGTGSGRTATETAEARNDRRLMPSTKRSAANESGLTSGTPDRSVRRGPASRDDMGAADERHAEDEPDNRHEAADERPRLEFPDEF